MNKEIGKVYESTILEYPELFYSHNSSLHAIRDLRGVLAYISSLKAAPNGPTLGANDFAYIDRILAETKEYDILTSRK